MKKSVYDLVFLSVGLGCVVGCTVVVLITLVFSMLNDGCVVVTDSFGELYFEFGFVLFGLLCFFGGLYDLFQLQGS